MEDLESTIDNSSQELDLENYSGENLWDYYLDKENNVGIINKQLIKTYSFLKKKKDFPKIFDSAFQIYVGGAMTRNDQEEFAEIAGRKGYKMTAKNSVISICMAPQYYLFSKGAGIVSDVLTGVGFDGETTGYGLAGLVVGGNLLRAGMALKNKKSYAGLSADSLIINSPSYFKKIVNSVIGK